MIPLTCAFRVSTIGFRGVDHFGFRSKFSSRRRFLMKRTSKCTLGLFIATFVATLLLAITASAQMNMPKPGPDHKKLDYFTGSWACDSDVKPGPMGPGGKMSNP